MARLLAGLALFFAVHSVAIFAGGWRERMVARVGPGTWKALYSVVSLVGFVLLVGGYADARLDAVALYHPPAWLRHVAALLMLPVFPLLLAAYRPGRIKAAVQHPMLTATMAWALAHLLVNGALPDVLLFGSFLAWAVADRVSVARRPAPASAGARGPVRNDVIAVVGGLFLYAAFVAWAHAWLTGVPVMP